MCTAPRPRHSLLVYWGTMAGSRDTGGSRRLFTDATFCSGNGFGGVWGGISVTGSGYSIF